MELDEEAEPSILNNSVADTSVDEKPIVSWPLLKAESMLYPELDDEHCLYRYEGLRDDAIKVTQYESRLKNLLSKKDLMNSDEVPTSHTSCENCAYARQRSVYDTL